MSKEHLFEDIKNATVDLNREECLKLVQEALDAGINPLEVIENGLKRGVQIVGTRYEEGELFIVDLMMVAAAMKAATNFLNHTYLQK